MVDNGNIEGYYRLGAFTRTHGVRGNLVLLLDVDNPDRYKKTKAVYLQVNGLLVKHEITTVSISGKNAIVHLKGVETVESAADFVKKDLFLPINELPKLSGNQVYFHEAIGMNVVDSTYGEIGKIMKIMDLPVQPIAVVQYGEGELLFPFLTQFIAKVDRANGILFVDLPDGLVDIYRDK